MGLREQLVFPEIDYDKIDKLRGLEITVVTSARTDQEARRLLELMGCPSPEPDFAARGTRSGYFYVRPFDLTDQPPDEIG